MSILCIAINWVATYNTMNNYSMPLIGQEVVLYVRERLVAEGLEALETTPMELDERLMREIATWTKLAKAATFTIN
jgi:hypothetical protein